MKRSAIVVGLIALLAISLVAADGGGDMLSVRIVPTRVSENGDASLTLYGPTAHFWVVLTNISKEPIRVWREWCSWGWYSLSFRVTDEKGVTTEVKKAARGWTKNYPDATVLQPGDHMVYEVAFDPETWPTAPLPEKGQSRKVIMTAVFAIEADQDAKKGKVWTGEVASPASSYTIYR